MRDHARPPLGSHGRQVGQIARRAGGEQIGEVAGR
jgi:hypothetical protein